MRVIAVRTVFSFKVYLMMAKMIILELLPTSPPEIAYDNTIHHESKKANSGGNWDGSALSKICYPVWIN